MSVVSPASSRGSSRNIKDTLPSIGACANFGLEIIAHNNYKCKHFFEKCKKMLDIQTTYVYNEFVVYM